KYREKIAKIFEYLPDDDIYNICLYFIKDNKDQIGLEIFDFVKDKPSKIKDLVKNLIKSDVVFKNLLIKRMIQEYKNLFRSDKFEILDYIIEYLGKSDRIKDLVCIFDDLIQAAKEIDDTSNRSEALSSIASALAQYPNQIDKASQLFGDLIQAAKEIDDTSNRS